jgi:hypothetical protein
MWHCISIGSEWKASPAFFKHMLIDEFSALVFTAGGW